MRNSAHPHLKLHLGRGRAGRRIHCCADVAVMDCWGEMNRVVTRKDINEANIVKILRYDMIQNMSLSFTLHRIDFRATIVLEVNKISGVRLGLQILCM